MAFPCGYNHSMASCASSTWQWPMGEKHLHMGHIMAPSGLSPADFRPSADACTKVFCERRKYSAKMAIFSSWSIQRDSFPCKSGEVPPRLAEKRKKLKLSCCIGFNNVPVLRPFSQNLYIYIWELCRTGGFVSVECRAGHIFSLWLNPQWRLLLDQESFAKYMVLWISAHFQTKQSPLTTQYHKEQMFWHLFLSHYICWLGPHNNIIIMIRIWYLVRENDDHDEEGDCGSVCLVLANKTCSRTGLTSLSLRTCTGSSLSITYH